MNKLKILVVDDDHDFAEGIAETLELNGHEVQLAFSGEEAIRKFKEEDYDISFMDVKMPGKNGVESFLEIRKFKPHANVVMMTAFSVHQLLEQAVESGAVGVLNKPFDMQSVNEMLNKIKPKGILLADDDQDFVDNIMEVLEEKGYNVYVAHDGREAVKRVQSNGIDVLILDVRMPFLNGLEVCLELKKSGHSIPTIIVTAYATEDAEIIDKLKTLSITGILTKPFDPKELLQALKDLVK
ncbi:MAG: response regulator [Candidatus Scalindua sp.]